MNFMVLAPTHLNGKNLVIRGPKNEVFLGKAERSILWVRQRKDKRKQCHDGALKNKKKTYEEDHYSTNNKRSGNDIKSDIVISDSKASVQVGGSRGHSNPEPFFMRDTKVQKSPGEVHPVYAISRTKREIGHKRDRTSTEGSAIPFTVQGRLCSLVRDHLRKLMFPTTETSIIEYNIPPVRIPWKGLGIWLYSRKKRFINWNRSISFHNNGRMNNYPSEELRKILMIDLVDWSEEEINFETVDVPLLLDPKGRVLVKVGNLPRMYPGYNWGIIYKQPVWFDNEEDVNSQNETQSLTTALHSPASSPSASRSSIQLSQPKREHRTRSPERDSLVVTDSDEERYSESQGESDSSSDYDDEEQNRMDRILMVTRPRMSLERKCKRAPSY